MTTRAQFRNEVLSQIPAAQALDVEDVAEAAEGGCWRSWSTHRRCEPPQHGREARGGRR